MLVMEKEKSFSIRSMRLGNCWPLAYCHVAKFNARPNERDSARRSLSKRPMLTRRDAIDERKGSKMGENWKINELRMSLTKEQNWSKIEKIFFY